MHARRLPQHAGYTTKCHLCLAGHAWGNVLCPAAAYASCTCLAVPHAHCAILSDTAALASHTPHSRHFLATGVGEVITELQQATLL
jgi:hypothetical protein